MSFAAADHRLVDRPWVVVDVETTGTSADGGDRITEFAAVVVEGGRVTREFATLVHPGRSIPAFITQLTGISDAMVAGAPRFGEVAGDIRALLDAGTFVAHNAAFDWGFVSTECARAGAPLGERDRVCTVRLARRLLRELPRRNLDSVCRHYGISIEARHRALGDAAATAQVFIRLLDALGRQGIDTWGEFDDWLARRTGRRKRSALPRSADDTFAA